MSRSNEYKVKGGSFIDPEDAISALDSLLEDVEATDAKSAYSTEIERQYHSNISGLQDCFDQVLTDVRPTWKALGLDGSFALVKEEASRESYKRKAVFQHPVYEHVWLTNSDGKNLAEDLLPFMYLNLEYQKEDSSVTLSYAKVETKLNLPELQTSLKAAREDLQLVKAEVERAGTVVSTALETVTNATAAIREYCNANSLNFDTAERAADMSAESEKSGSEKKKTEQPEVVASSESNLQAESDDTENLVVDDDDLSLPDDIDEDDDDLISELEGSLDDDDDDEIEEEIIQASSSRISTPPPLSKKRY